MQNNVLVLGVDGLDPRLAKHYLDKGVMPNFKKFLARGSAREDLVMLGAMPTITPPMWTTLATGAYPGTHGVTCFWNQHPTKLDTLIYAFDSKNCHAEQLWNVFAEAGRNTLVWHWPGSSWPPTSDSPNLSVVDGTQPSNINIAVGTLEWEQWIEASVLTTEVVVEEREDKGDGAGCIISDMEIAQESLGALDLSLNTKELTAVMTSKYAGEYAGADNPSHIEDLRKTSVPIKEAQGWVNAPEGAKEFIIPISKGLERRPVLILQNENGIYDHLAIYKTKKATEPMITLTDHQLVNNFMDTVLKNGEHKLAARQLKMIHVAPDGSAVDLFVGCAMDATCDLLFHPKDILQDIRQNVGELRSIALSLGSNKYIAEELDCPLWEAYSEWQANCINYLIESRKFEVVFSHLHNVDIMGHRYWERAKQRPEFEPYDSYTEKDYQEIIQRVYVDTDRYLGRFLHLLDQGWNIIVTSDHGLICAEEESPAVGLGDPFGVNGAVMIELGYTAIKQDETEKDVIDWQNTTALASRGNHIYLNLKNRDEHGIVDPADRYELERKLIDDLYGYRDQATGKRIVSLVLRAKEAAVIGLKGKGCGDLIYFLEEGFNRVHGDSMSTFCGYANTSVSPIFMAAGPNIKQNYITDRVIREVDVAPTVAVLGGVRMPAQCEGAPVYQIIEN